MKKLRRMAILVVSCMLVLAIVAPAALADALYGVIKTPMKDGSVNLRAKAGVTQRIVGWGQNGDEVEVLYRGNTWHRVRLLKNGKTGWMYGRYLKITGSAPSGSASAGAAVSGTVGQIMTKYPSSTVNLRYGAGTGYGIINEYGRGTRLEILDQSGNWYRVQIAGTDTTGWISRTYVSLGLSARTTARVNLRYGAGTDYRVITTLPYGQDVTVTWVGGSWSKVQAGEMTGYISNRYYSFR